MRTLFCATLATRRTRIHGSKYEKSSAPRDESTEGFFEKSAPLFEKSAAVCEKFAFWAAPGAREESTEAARGAREESTEATRFVGGGGVDLKASLSAWCRGSTLASGG